MDFTILRPTWFVDNADWGFAGRLCMTGWRENLKGRQMQVTTTADVGNWAVESLLRPDRAGLRNEALSIASDEITFAQLNDIMLQHTGHTVPTTNTLLAKVLIWLFRDLNTMFQFIGERPYGADLPWLQSYASPTTVTDWIQGFRENSDLEEESNIY